MPTLALTFLDPLAGALAAGLAVPALLLLYFLKLRRRPVRVTASFLWQRAAEDLQVNTPFRWLRLSLVFLLQLLALLMLCAALARPALTDLPPARGRVIVLLDASASMRAVDSPDGPSRFEQARTRVAELLGSLDLGADDNGERTEVMLLAFAHEPRVLANFTTDRGELAGALARAEPTDQPGDLRAALAIVDAFAAQTAAEEDGRAATLVVVSDGQDALGAENLSVAAEEVRFVRVGPPAAEPKSNLGVALLSARHDTADPTTVRVFARLVNASPDPIEVAPVLEIDGVARGVERGTVPGARASTPGELAVALEAPAPGRSIVTLRLPVDDALASDNAASVVLDAPGGVDVVLVSPTGAVPDRAAPDPFLREALEAIRPRTLRVLTLARHDETIAGGSIVDADLVIYDRVSPALLPAIPSLSIGAAPPVEGLRLRDPDAPRATRFTTWRRTDPLLRSVSLGETLVARPLVMTLPEVGAGRVSRVEPLAFGESGPLIASMTVAGIERVVVAFDLAQSTWPLDVGFAIFLANAVETLAPRAAIATGRSFTTAEPLLVVAAPGAERVVADGPTQLEARVDPARDLSGSVSLGVPTRVGIYALTGAGGAAEGPGGGESVAAVNLANAQESSAATLDALPIAARSGDSAAAGEAAPREVWEWFVLGALGLFVLEWLLFAWRMRV